MSSHVPSLSAEEALIENKYKLNEVRLDLKQRCNPPRQVARWSADDERHKKTSNPGLERKKNKTKE